MFSDRLAAWFKRTDINELRKMSSEGVVSITKHAEILITDEHTQRYSLSPQIAELAARLSLNFKSMTSIVKNVMLPADTIWIEWSTPDSSVHADITKGFSKDIPIKKLGIIIEGRERCKMDAPIHAGGAAVFCETEDGRAGYCLHFTFEFINENVEFTMSSDSKDKQKDVVTHLCFMIACCAILNTGRIFEHKENDLSKLNKSRVKQGKEPLHNYTEVVMPKETADAIAGANFGEEVKGKRGRHHVQTFVRIRMGQVEIVRPHWRGHGPLKDGSALVKRYGEGTVRHEGERRIIKRDQPEVGRE